MTYNIVLKDGNEVNCFAKDADNVVEMMIGHDIYIVQENGQPTHATYIKKEDVSYFRLPANKDGVAKPVV